MCSHMRNLASAVDQYSSSQPTSLIFDPTSECNLNKFFFKLRERQSHLLARKKTPADISKRDAEACVLTPSIPAGRCVGCCVGCILGMPEISPFVFIAASYQLHGIL